MASIMVLGGVLLLAVVVDFTGLCMLCSPRRFAVVCEVFAAGGGLPSLLPRSVRTAILQVQAFGVCFLVFGAFLIGEAVNLVTMPGMLHMGENSGPLYWMVIPAMLGIAAGYLILAYGADWVRRTFGKWAEHPMVSRGLILALTWEVRLAGAAFALFGLGATSLWIGSMMK